MATKNSESKSATQTQKSHEAGLGVTAGSDLKGIIALRKKLIQQNEARAAGGKTFLPWIKVETGNIVKVRILPLAFNNNMPFITVKEHRNLYPDATFRAVVCPRSVGGGECPICEYIDEHYRAARENDDKGAISAIKPLFGKPRAYAVVYNRTTKRMEKIGMSTTLLGQILSEVDEELGDPTDVLHGRDGKLSAVKGANGFNNYSFAYSELSTPLADTEEEIQNIMHELDEHSDEIMRLKTPMSYDEISALLKAAASDDIPDDMNEDDDDSISDDDVEAVIAKIHKGKN